VHYNSLYITKRGNVFYYQRRVNNFIIKRSLRASCKSEAVAKARDIHLRMDREDKEAPLKEAACLVESILGFPKDKVYPKKLLTPAYVRLVLLRCKNVQFNEANIPANKRYENYSALAGMLSSASAEFDHVVKDLEKSCLDKQDFRKSCQAVFTKHYIIGVSG
jgi:hypothetical protein